MSKFNFEQVKQNLEQVKRDLPRLMANDAQNYFLKAFRNQSWNGVPWPEVKRRMGPGSEGGGDKGTPEWRYPKSKGLSRRTNNILQMSNRLRREVSNVAGAASITHSVFNFKVTLRLNQNIVPYGSYQNDGTDKIPKRQFMGDTPELRRILRSRIDTFFKKIWTAKAA